MCVFRHCDPRLKHRCAGRQHRLVEQTHTAHSWSEVLEIVKGSRDKGTASVNIHSAASWLCSCLRWPFSTRPGAGFVDSLPQVVSAGGIKLLLDFEFVL